MRTDVRLLSPPRRPWWVRLLNRMGGPVAWQPMPPGRDRIDPCLPYGHWAAGWERPAMPPTKKRPQAAGTTGGHGANRLATIRFDFTTKGGETQ